MVQQQYYRLCVLSLKEHFPYCTQLHYFHHNPALPHIQFASNGQYTLQLGFAQQDLPQFHVLQSHAVQFHYVPHHHLFLQECRLHEQLLDNLILPQLFWHPQKCELSYSSKQEHHIFAYYL